MEEIETYNIPAFKREKSIVAKAKKTKNQNPSSPPIGTKKKNMPKTTTKKKKQDGLYLREMKTCGICDGYFDSIKVSIIKLTSPIRKGDIIIMEKQGGLFEQELKSIQINRKDVTVARTGEDIGIKTIQKPKVGGNVYKVM